MAEIGSTGAENAVSKGEIESGAPRIFLFLAHRYFGVYKKIP